MATKQNKMAFLIISNARAGSTYLMTSLGALPGVFTDYQLSWRTRLSPSPVEIVIPGPGYDCRELLEGLNAGSRVVGSKLTLTSGALLTAEDVNGLSTCIDPHIRILNLTRHYWEILKSATARGFYHSIEPGDNRIDWGSEIFKAIVDSNPKLSTSPPLRHVEASLGALRTSLICYFVNDLVAIEIARKAERSLHVSYSRIQEDFPEIVDCIGASRDEKTWREIMDHPITKKLDNIPDSTVPYADQLKPLADHFYRKTLELIEQDLPVSSVWDGYKGLTV